jgi:hypothetical protein
MSTNDRITYAFCTETLRYAYQIMGYDAIRKEIDFIHHLHASRESVLSPSSNPVVVDAEPVMEVMETEENVKQLVIPVAASESSSKYARTEVPDELRCTAIVKKDGEHRCTYKRDPSNKQFCTRHARQ